MGNERTGTALAPTHISNPLYSKLLDVHRYSDHSEVRLLCKTIWTDCFGSPHGTNPKKGGVKPKASSLQQLQTVIIDLYSAWSTDPELSVGVAMSNTAWDTGSRYNKLQMSRQTPKIIHRLHEKGYVDLNPGSYAGPGAKTNRNTRIRATEKLCVLFREAKFGPQHLLTHPEKECIILRGTEKSERNIEYQDTDETMAMRAELRAYNRLLQRTFIDVPNQELPFIERPNKKGERKGEMSRMPVCGMDNHVYRVFNREAWDCGGRYYGGWWQGCGGEFRKRIHINDEPTVEVDYRALHVAMLAAKSGCALQGDPYSLELGLIEGVNEPERQRKVVKLLTLMGLNATSKAKAFSAFRDASTAGSLEKSLTNKQLEKVLNALIKKLPFLKEGLCTDQGIHLMYLDSKITALILRHFTSRDIPVLGIHDSFIIDYRRARQLKTVMSLAARKVLGSEVEVSQNYQGLDEIERDNPSLAEDYLAFRSLPRCSAYLVRQRLFKERLLYVGSLGSGELAST